jgi:hypothetical protein
LRPSTPILLFVALILPLLMVTEAKSRVKQV